MVTNKQWKLVKGFTRYEVSNDGEVRNVHTKELKAIRKTKTGYYITDLKENGVKCTKYVHRLVAEAFVSNPDNMPCVNHKDENKLNNDADNLEWCSVAYNNSYGTKNERAKRTQTVRVGKKVNMIDVNTNEVINSFESISEGAKFVGVSKQAIDWALSSENHTCAGFKWKVVMN